MPTDVCGLNELPDGGKKTVKAGGTSILLLRSGTTVHAVAPKCPHMGLPLKVGSWDGSELKCRFHGARFKGDSGECTKRAWLLGSVGDDNLKTWPVTVQDGRILVEV